MSVSDIPNLPEPPNPDPLPQGTASNSALSHQPLATTGPDPRLALLRTWQSERLKRTYADLLDDQHSRAVCLFFLSDIYAPRDFSQRNDEAERVHVFLSRIVPPPVLQLLAGIIELNRMTDNLDHQLLGVLVEQLNVSDAITVEQYAEGYRRCDNFAARSEQIDRVTDIVTKVGEGAHIFGIGIAIQLLRQPALAAGWAHLYDFLIRGYDAFRQMRDVQGFAKIIGDRERRILDQIFAGMVDPFTLN